MADAVVIGGGPGAVHAAAALQQAGRRVVLLQEGADAGQVSHPEVPVGRGIGEAPSHSLGKIVRHLQLPPADKAHRALADAEMTAHLLLRMQADLRSRWHIPDPSHALLSELQVCQRKHLGRWLSNTSARQTQPQLPELVATLAPKAAAARR